MDACLEGCVDVAGIPQVRQTCRQIPARALPRWAEVQALMPALQLASEAAAGVLECSQGRLRKLPAWVHDLRGGRRVLQILLIAAPCPDVVRRRLLSRTGPQCNLMLAACAAMSAYMHMCIPPYPVDDVVSPSDVPSRVQLQPQLSCYEQG